MTASKFIGSLIGLAIGDSLGARWEGYLAPGDVGDISSRYTDDTAMMIGVAESLIACRGFNGQDMTERFMANYEKEPWRGYGSGPPRIFRSIRQGANWHEEIDKRFFPGGSYGNGSAMRVAPIGLLYCDSPDELRKVAYEASSITHSHPLAMEGAAIEAYAVALALKEEKNFLDKLIDFTQVDIYKRKLTDCGFLLSRKGSKEEIISKLGNGIEAFNSVPTAIFSFLAHTTFEASLIYAVSLGGDTDTIAAMCGAIAGAKHGVENIPHRWVANLENREYIENLAKNLFATWTSQFSTS
ncbi:MAG: ADP-ribosylglycohydrolase family protein [bacterium]